MVNFASKNLTQPLNLMLQLASQLNDETKDRPNTQKDNKAKDIYCVSKVIQFLFYDLIDRSLVVRSHFQPVYD